MCDHIGEVGTGGFEHPGRRVLRIDFGIALVAEDQETEPPGEIGETAQIGAGRHRALGVGRGRDIERHGAGEQVVRKRIKIGEKSGRGGCRQVDRLAIGRQGACRIGRIEWIGHQNGGTADSAADPVAGRDGGQEQPFAGPVEHQDLGVWVDRPRQRESAAEPVGGGAAERFDAFVHRIAAKFVDMCGQHRADETGYRMLRLAHRQADRRLARLRVAQ